MSTARGAIALCPMFRAQPSTLNIKPILWMAAETTACRAAAPTFNFELSTPNSIELGRHVPQRY